jgi:hypothetical protein
MYCGLGNTRYEVGATGEECLTSVDRSAIVGLTEYTSNGWEGKWDHLRKGHFDPILAILLVIRCCAQSVYVKKYQNK